MQIDTMTKTPLLWKTATPQKKLGSCAWMSTAINVKVVQVQHTCLWPNTDKFVLLMGMEGEQRFLFSHLHISPVFECHLHRVKRRIPERGVPLGINKSFFDMTTNPRSTHLCTICFLKKRLLLIQLISSYFLCPRDLVVILFFMTIGIKIHFPVITESKAN